MLEAIIQASNRHATRPALVLDDRTYTYQELFGLVGSLCETLKNLKEDIIGITAENCIETYASILAVLLSGKTYVILHPDYPAERNCRIARHPALACCFIVERMAICFPPISMPDVCVSPHISLLRIPASCRITSIPKCLLILSSPQEVRENPKVFPYPGIT